jgi:hypothetical protein
MVYVTSSWPEVNILSLLPEYFLADVESTHE